MRVSVSLIPQLMCKQLNVFWTGALSISRLHENSTVLLPETSAPEHSHSSRSTNAIHTDTLGWMEEAQLNQFIIHVVKIWAYHAGMRSDLARRIRRAQQSRAGDTWTLSTNHPINGSLVSPVHNVSVWPRDSQQKTKSEWSQPQQTAWEMAEPAAMCWSDGVRVLSQSYACGRTRLCQPNPGSDSR